jgi:hypothetical protein
MLSLDCLVGDDKDNPTSTATCQRLETMLIHVRVNNRLSSHIGEGYESATLDVPLALSVGMLAAGTVLEPRDVETGDGGYYTESVRGYENGRLQYELGNYQHLLIANSQPGPFWTTSYLLGLSYVGKYLRGEKQRYYSRIGDYDLYFDNADLLPGVHTVAQWFSLPNSLFYREVWDRHTGERVVVQ